MQNRTHLIVACPQCGTEHAWDTANSFRPFCCKRCKLIDLGRWANEEYRIEHREQDFPEADHQA